MTELVPKVTADDPRLAEFSQKLADKAGISAQQLYEVITAPETCADRRGEGAALPPGYVPEQR